jgi:predicted TIM-barrel fold metal-dependent hydrolase
LDVAVLFRTFPLHCDDSLAPDYANALCRAWNDWMADFCRADPKRLRPSALITLHDVDLAVDETRRAINQLGAIGLCLVPEPSNGKHIHDRYYDPVWREAEKLGVPVCFHPAASPNQDQAVHRFRGQANEAVLINAFRNPIELMFAVGSFCAGGVLERFPRLRVAVRASTVARRPSARYWLTMSRRRVSHNRNGNDVEPKAPRLCARVTTKHHFQPLEHPTTSRATLSGGAHASDNAHRAYTWPDRDRAGPFSGCFPM